MTTAAFSMMFDHTSNEGFRAWGSEVSSRLASLGLVQTEDTGQIDWETATRPSINQSGGYEIWRFDDTLQATAPIFIRLEYRTGSNATRPEIWVLVGTGSDGAGNLTTPRAGGAFSASPTSGATTSPAVEQCRMCVTEGYLFVALGMSAISSSMSRVFFIVARSVDTSGEHDGVGVSFDFIVNTSSGGHAFYRFAAPGHYFSSTTGGNILIPHNESSTLIDGNSQAYLAWTATPEIAPAPHMCAVYVDEIPEGVTFDAKLIGDQVRTYLCVGRQGGAYWASGVAASSVGLGVLWE